MRVGTKKNSLAVACALALGVLSSAAGAQVQQDEKALLLSPSGAVVKSGFGLCMHSGFGPAPAWREECHPSGQEKVTFAADILFDSDQSTLLPAGRQTLDQFANKVHGLDGKSVLAIGYADRMGSTPDNQELSQQRVNAVKTYLVGKGIAADRVRTRAKGEASPTTYAGECKEEKNAKNIACLQPDRHVYVEVSGTRVAK